MDYNELRKGNLLYFPFINGNAEVIGVNALYGVNETYFNNLTVKEGINLYYESIGVFKPISLTKELFENLISNYTNGSKKLNHRWIAFHNMHLDIYWHEEEKYFYYHTNQLQSIKILYVHDFQNLIFALSKIEITLK